MDKLPASATSEAAKDDIYLRIWEVEQKHTTIRWTVATFFLSVSFAIFGISLQIDNAPIPRIVPQLGAIAIYWFTYILFLRFNDYTHFLRNYLKEMESSKQTTLDLQTESNTFMSSEKKLSATHLLLYFGIGYTVVGIIGLLFLH
jgi:hypothetical protein